MKLLRRLLAVLAALIVIGVAFAWRDLQNAWRATHPVSVYESEPVALPADLGTPAILLFTKTNGFRHEEGIPAGVALIEAIAKRAGWSVFHTESGAAFTSENLARFSATVWHQVSGDVLNDAQREALKTWIEDGGGWVGIHGAGGDSSYAWPWYKDVLLGAQFIGHPMGPQFQDATLVIEDRTHPATSQLPERFVHNEEWYSFDGNPREGGYHILATVDESSYEPRLRMLGMDRDLRMGADHPVIWWHCVGRGRAFYSALGHQAKSYQTPETEDLLEGAIAWAARVAGEGCE
ncbi:MAG: ThuA domain-containing protein [Myxococcota bacterium]